MIGDGSIDELGCVRGQSNSEGSICNGAQKDSHNRCRARNLCTNVAGDLVSAICGGLVRVETPAQLVYEKCPAVTGFLVNIPEVVY